MAESWRVDVFGEYGVFVSLLDIELICTAIRMWQWHSSWVGITRPTNNSLFIETLKKRRGLYIAGDETHDVRYIKYVWE